MGLHTVLGTLPIISRLIHHYYPHLQMRLFRYCAQGHAAVSGGT